jgi:phosphoglucosamine mutase
MDRTGAVLGGEQSGHIIHRGLATTGDGLLAAVQLMAALARSSRTIDEAARGAMSVYPQVLINVRVEGNAKSVVEASADVIREAEAQLGAEGRVLVRASGTEPLVRVMVEASDAAIAQSLAQRIADHAAKVRG